MQINHPNNPAPAGEREWSTLEMMEEFETIGFLAPFVEVRRKSDGQHGMMQFHGIPRTYHSFQPIND